MRQVSTGGYVKRQVADLELLQQRRRGCEFGSALKQRHEEVGRDSPELFEEGGGLRQGQVFNVPFSTLSSEVSMGHAVARDLLHHADDPTTMTMTPTMEDGPMAVSRLGKVMVVAAATAVVVVVIPLGFEGAVTVTTYQFADDGGAAAVTRMVATTEVTMVPTMSATHCTQHAPNARRRTRGGKARRSQYLPFPALPLTYNCG